MNNRRPNIKHAVIILTLLSAAGLLGMRAMPLIGMSRQLLTSQDDDSPAAVEVSQKEWNFGTVATGTVLTAEFLVRNRGGKRLVLREVGAGCECVATRFAEFMVDPGESRLLPITFNTSQLAGNLRIEMRFTTNDPTQPTISFFVTAQIRMGSNQVTSGSRA